MNVLMPRHEDGTQIFMIVMMKNDLFSVKPLQGRNQIASGIAPAVSNVLMPRHEDGTQIFMIFMIVMIDMIKS